MFIFVYWSNKHFHFSAMNYLVVAESPYDEKLVVLWNNMISLFFFIWLAQVSFISVTSSIEPVFQFLHSFVVVENHHYEKLCRTLLHCCRSVKHCLSFFYHRQLPQLNKYFNFSSLAAIESHYNGKLVVLFFIVLFKESEFEWT